MEGEGIDSTDQNVIFACWDYCDYNQIEQTHWIPGSDGDGTWTVNKSHLEEAASGNAIYPLSDHTFYYARDMDKLLFSRLRRSTELSLDNVRLYKLERINFETNVIKYSQIPGFSGYPMVRHAPWADDWRMGVLLISQAGLWQSVQNWNGKSVVPEPHWFFKKVKGKLLKQILKKNILLNLTCYRQKPREKKAQSA